MLNREQKSSGNSGLRDVTYSPSLGSLSLPPTENRKASNLYSDLECSDTPHYTKHNCQIRVFHLITMTLDGMRTFSNFLY